MTMRLKTAELVATAVCATLAGAVMAQGRGDAARGEQLFYDHACYGCHGYNGETGARDLVGTGSPLVEDLDAFRVFMRARADFAPLFPTTRMPSYSEATLSDAELADLFAYIQSFELDAPDLDDVPALRAIIESADEP